MIPLDPNHQCTNFWASGRSRVVPVRWAKLADLFNGFEGVTGARDTWAGVCGYSHRVFHLCTNTLEPLMVRDIYITPKRGCEEGRRCLARQCPLNRTRDAWLRDFLQLKRRQPTPQKLNVTQPALCQMFEQRPAESAVYLPPPQEPK
jgi:hypothetical protein